MHNRKKTKMNFIKKSSIENAKSDVEMEVKEIR